MQKARWRAEAAGRPGSGPEERPTRAGRRRRQGGGQLRGGARVREAPRSSRAVPAAGGQAVQPQAHSSGGRSPARTPRLAQPAPLRTARGRGRDPGVFRHHAPYTCPGSVAPVTKRAPPPRPWPVRLSSSLPDPRCATARVNLLGLGPVVTLRRSVSFWPRDAAPEVRSLTG